MKLNELVEKHKKLEGVWNTEGAELARPIFLQDLEQLDEPETGHADEAPRYVKNILARLRELPVHDREVWLKAIMGEFEKDFSHAKWREGYEQGKLEGEWVGNQLKDADKIRRELNQVKVPQFVADVIEGAREQSPELEDALHYTWGNGTKEFTEWYNKKSNRDLFARAWLDGYEVEEEKRYRISMPKTRNYKNNAQLLCEKDGKIFWCGEWHPFRTKFTRKQLEEAGFGWVFSCEGVEIEEVE